MVLQAPVIRALIIVCDIVAVAELREDAKIFLRYSNMLSVGSLLLAIFGVHTLARVTSVSTYLTISLHSLFLTNMIRSVTFHDYLNKEILSEQVIILLFYDNLPLCGRLFIVFLSPTANALPKRPPPLWSY